MTREEYRAQKALQEKRRATERKGYEAAKGSMDLSFLLLTLLLTLYPVEELTVAIEHPPFCRCLKNIIN